MRICMFVYNRCTTDARVLREAATLRSAGHELTIVAVLDSTTEPREVLPDGTQIVRIDRRPLHYRLAWWVRARRRALRLTARRGARNLVALLFSPFAGRASGAAVERAAAEHGIESTHVLRLALAPLWPVYALLAAVSTGGRRVLYTAHKPLMYYDFWRRAYRVAAAGGFDVLHANDLNTLPPALVLARRTGTPLVYDAHELYPEVSTLSSLERRVWRTLEPPLIRRTDRVITVCDSIADEIVRRYRVPRPMVMLNCPPSLPVSDPAESPLRAAIGLADGSGAATGVVLYQGGFAPNRGLVELVLAMHEVGDAILVLMGWGRLEEELRRLVAQERLDETVRFLPPVHRGVLQQWSAGADVGVIPYQAVGLNNTYSTPNKLFEYLSAAVPIAASDLPEIKRIVEGHGIGLTFGRITPEAIAATLNRLGGDPGLRATMRGRALSIRHRYTWETQAQHLLDVYEQVRPKSG